MKARIIASTACALTLAFAALPARADHGSRGRGHAEDVALARALQRATGELYREAVARAGRVNRREANALDALRRLDHRSDALRARVEWYGLQDSRTGRELHALRHDLGHASARLAAVSHGHGLRRELARVEALVRRFDARFAAGPPRGGRYAGRAGSREGRYAGRPAPEVGGFVRIGAWLPWLR